jgi:2-polyprenyl-6-methoxyphenol hydroxylase-like FAD-dependent oxidoreductase
MRTGVRVVWGPALDIPVDTAGFRWVIGADGIRSRIRCAAGINCTSRECSRFGFRRHYRLAPWTDFVEVYWGEDCQVYVTPVGSSDISVALLTRYHRLRLDSVLGAFPVLQRRLARAVALTSERGGLTVSRRLDRVVNGKILLIGDASGSVDAITGEGMSLAFCQSVVLAAALRAGDPTRYQVAHRALGRRPTLAAWFLLMMDHFPTVRHTIIRVLATRPELFAKLLALHTPPLEGVW